MKLKISINSLLKKQFLVVESDGVKFYDGTGFSGAKRYRFRDILCVLLGPDHTLSFQVGQEVFSIPTKPDDKTHQEVIASLVQMVKDAASG